METNKNVYAQPQVEEIKMESEGIMSGTESGGEGGDV